MQSRAVREVLERLGASGADPDDDISDLSNRNGLPV
jgi:hypothetical protein